VDSETRVWIITYRLKIRRQWGYHSICGASLAHAEARWEAVKTQALASRWDYDMIYKSPAQGQEIEGLVEEPCQ